MQNIIDYLRANQSRFIEELSDYVRFPSVSAQPQHRKDLQACAEWVVKHCREIGLEARLCPTQGNPIVVAKTPRPRAGETARILSCMAITMCSPPSRSSCGSRRRSSRALQGRSLFGRGASDNKGQNLAHLKAVEAYLETGTELPCDLTFVIEGEEEVGSKSLAAFLKEHRDRAALRCHRHFRHGHADAQAPGPHLRLAGHRRVRR